MSLKVKLRNYREKNESFEEYEEYTDEYSGYLFHSKEEIDHFQDVDDFFSAKWDDDFDLYQQNISV